MNTIGKSFSERLKTGTDALKQKSEVLTAKAGEAIASAQKAVQENMENNNNGASGGGDPNNFDESAIAPPADGSTELTTTTAAEKTSDEKQQQQQQQQKPNIAANLTEGFKGMMAKFPNDKNHNQEVVVTDLVEVLSSLFDFDPKAKTKKHPHEMVEALELEGITTWRAFLLMAEEDIPTLRKKGDVPIAKNSIRMLTYLKQLVMYNINNDVENARDPALYTREAFDGFVEDLQLGRKDPRAKEPSAAGEEEGGMDEDGKPKRNNIRQSLTGFASRLKPGARVEDGSLADILTKAKAKVFHKRGSSGNDGSGKPGVGDEVSVDEDAGSVVSDLGTTTTTVAGGNAGVEAAVASGTTLEDMKKNVDDLASKLKKTSTDTAGKTKEEVQKMMVPLLSNLKKSQDKFAALVEARKRKNAEKKAARIAAGEEDVDDDDEEGGGATEDDDKFKHLFDDDDTGKLRNLLSHAEKATMKAFHDAETVARQAARKAGILEGKEEEEDDGGSNNDGDGDAVASPAASGKEEAASVRV